MLSHDMRLSRVSNHTKARNDHLQADFFLRDADGSIDRQQTMQSPKPLPDPLPDAQQRHHFWHTEKSCMLQAGAGCGKTTEVLTKIQKHPDKSFLLLYYNRNIKNEIAAEVNTRSLPNVAVRTIHSVAYELLGLSMSTDDDSDEDQAKGKALRAEVVDGLLASHKSVVEVAVQARPDCVGKKGNPLLAKAVRELYDSVFHDKEFIKNVSDDNLTADVVKAVKTLRQVVETKIISGLRQGKFFSHDWVIRACVKLRLNEKLSKKVDRANGYDAIVFDECQDLNKLLYQMVPTQRDDLQLIFMGDVNQRINSWNGTINAFTLPELQSLEKIAFSQCFRCSVEIKPRMFPGP